jgi:hypothetical protein
MPIGVDRVALISAGGVNENYFGDGSDGSFSSSGDTELNPLNDNGYWDADMIVKNYTSFTLNSTHNYFSGHPARGLLCYISGDMTVSGYLTSSNANDWGPLVDPTATGGSDSAAVGSNGIRFPMFTASGTDTLSAADFAGSGTAAVTAVANHPAISGNGTIFGMVRQGAAGSPGGAGTPATAPAGATVGGMGQSGGGGGGGGTGTGGAGSYGSCFGGGSGGGGGSPGPGGAATAWGGAGGSGGGSASTGGGGNPGGGPGTQPCYVGARVRSGDEGTAGGVGPLFIFIVGGNILVNSGGEIISYGTNSSEIRTYYAGCGISNGSPKATGGGSGAGGVIVLHKGTYTNNGNVSSTGSTGGHPSNLDPRTWGGTGGNGSLIVSQVS